MPETPLSIEALILEYLKVRPREGPTLYSIMKNVALPHLKERRLKGETIQEGCARVPAHRLYALLDRSGTAWTETVRSRLPKSDTHQKAYCRAIRRLIAHGEEHGMLHPDEHAISPAWRQLIRLLEPLTSDRPAHKRSALRNAFKRLARWATREGLAPSDVPGEAQEGCYLLDFRAALKREEGGDYFRARIAWNLVVEAHPDLALRPWGLVRDVRHRGVSVERWPPAVREGLESLARFDPFNPWRPATRQGYENQLAVYLGILRDAGIDLAALFDGLVDGASTFRLLFQGLPPALQQESSSSWGCRLAEMPTLRAQVLDGMRALAGTYEGKASEPNPLLVHAIEVLADSGRITSASNLVSKTLAINRGLLGMTERHTGWCLRLKAQLAQRAKRSPSAYSEKKRIFFKRPELWEQLVAARARMRSFTRSIEDESRACLGGRREALRRRWAVALRNEVYFGLMLCYPLRASNYSAMEIGRHFDPACHRIYFPAAETKNGKEIDYELPDGGSLGDLRGLMRQYLEEARPVLLAGRSSPYLFVPCERGGTRIPARGFNAILAEIGRKFLGDLVPAGAKGINPHMLRHICASYYLGVHGNLNLAAQILNDSPATITKSYADILEHKKEATKRFLSAYRA